MDATCSYETQDRGIIKSLGVAGGSAKVGPPELQSIELELTMESQSGSLNAESAEEFVRLFSRSQSRVLRFIHTLVPNLAAAEDILQETSVVLWKKWPQFDRDKDFVKWACGIARFEVFRMLRGNKRSVLYLDEVVLNQIADIAMSEAHDTARYEAGKSALEECLQKLPTRHTEILNLRYRHERTVQQIAEMCNRPKSTVHDLLAKIRFQLLRCVQSRLGA